MLPRLSLCQGLSGGRLLTFFYPPARPFSSFPHRAGLLKKSFAPSGEAGYERAKRGYAPAPLFDLPVPCPTTQGSWERSSLGWGVVGGSLNKWEGGNNQRW